MKDKSSTCCKSPDDNTGIKRGVLYGLLPHTFCIAFIIFSILGTVGVTSFFRSWLLTPYFFPLLVTISVILTVCSAILYLRQSNCLSLSGIKKKARYLSIMAISIIGVNLLLFLVAFPLAANFSPNNKIGSGSQNQSQLSQLTLSVELPCSGHAPLVMKDLQQIPGIADINFRLPNLFDIKYSDKTSANEILKAQIFNNFKATII